MRDLSPKEFETPLQIIYSYEFLHYSHLRKDAQDIYARLAADHGLSREEVKLLAFLGLSRGYKDIHTCCKAMNLPIEEMIGMLKKLVRKGAVCERTTAGCEEDTIYSMDEDYHDDLNLSKVVRNFTERQLHNVVTDFSEELRSGSADAEKGCRQMEMIIRLNPCLQFSKGYSEIGAAAFPLHEKCALFMMAGYFILNGTKPIDDNWIGQSIVATKARKTRIADYLYGQNGGKDVAQSETIKNDSSVPSLSPDSLREGIQDLMRHGLVSAVSSESNNDSSSKKLYLISERACRALFRGMTFLIDYATLSHRADVILCRDIEPKELYFDESGDGQLEILKTVVAPERYARFVDSLQKRGMSKAVTVLFHGAPGTGKTELARQLARESGRDLFVADAAKLFDTYWGESEKNMRELFRSFKYVNALSSQAPILLFNEADGIIGKRISVRRSIDKSENAVLSIVLQELETFEGVFIATTNQASHLEDAFDRRFLFKVEFFNPSPQTAARIWMEKIPEMTQEEALHLSLRFSFSGGKIENVAKKRLLLEAVSDAPVTFPQMMELCRNEELKSEGEEAYFRHFRIVRNSDIKPCSLFFDENILSAVDMIRKMVVSDRFDEIVSALKQEGLSGAVNILLHGAPGTGKTELALQLARESGRDIYIVDVAKLSDGIIGTGEQEVRELFAKFRHLHVTADRAPILLFNEADGIIGKRLQVERASDKDENAIQSVLLQELESFEGIFMATTNLIGNIDEAFDRRFLFKVEFRKPSPLTAAKIWRARIPELNYEEAIALGEEFSFSGGQIDNIAKRRTICKVVYQRTPSQEELRQYCIEEQFKARESIHGAVPTQGFSQYLG